MKYERIDLGMGMGVRARAGSDRLRTIWTQEMDRYFIDLMLEQIGKWNNGDDHMFSKQAWMHMTCLFNDKFKFQYDKDVLKNRHKTLRNLYRAVQHMLDQEGFSWDETRKMLTADNKVWDEYIKVHPKSRSFRIKPVPYFRDLCVIYKHANLENKVTIACHGALCKDSELQSDSGSMSEGEKSEDEKSDIVKAGAMISLCNVGETLHDIALMEDYGVSVTTGIVDDTLYPVSDSGSAVATRTRTCWQPQMDFYFINLMLDQVQKGNRVDGLFRREAWMEMLASFNAKFGFNYEIDILKNRYKSMRRQYTIISNLLKLDGFVWDDARQMVTADDLVWQNYIKVHTTARQYMTRPVPYYKDLCVICGELSSDGKDGISGHNVEQQDEAFENKFGVLLKSLESPRAIVFSDDQVGKEDSSHDVIDQTSKRQLETPSGPELSKRARSKDDGIANALREMASTVSSLASTIKEDERSNSIAIENVVKAVQALPDMDEELVLDACDFLEDDKRAKTFLALDVKLRKKWLIRKLRPQQQ